MLQPVSNPVKPRILSLGTPILICSGFKSPANTTQMFVVCLLLWLYFWVKVQGMGHILNPSNFIVGLCDFSRAKSPSVECRCFTLPRERCDYPVRFQHKDWTDVRRYQERVRQSCFQNKRNRLERWLRGSETFLLCQRTRIWFLAPEPGSFHWPVTSDPLKPL